MFIKRLICYSPALLALIVLLGAGWSIAPGTQAAPQAGATTIYLPLVIGPPGGSPPPAGSLPAELVGTWFHGQLLNLQFYNRDTGIWSDAGGLGHMYVFGADGSYTLVSYLKLGEGTTCVSTVAKYESGTAHAAGSTLLLTPSVARTRTQICGNPSATDIEGSHDTYSLPWQVGLDANSHVKLWLDEVQGRTDYYKDGLAAHVIGDWANNDGGAIWLFDPESGQWVDPTGVSSEWYAFYPNGTYRHGVIDAGFGDDPCRTVTMRYEEGILGGSGSNITLETTAGLRHTVSLCDPSDAIDEPLSAGSFERWSWGIPIDAGGNTLDLLRIEGGFRSIHLLRVQ